MWARIADWHGEQAAKAYCDWQRSSHDDDFKKYIRHVSIADRLWKRKK